MPDPTTIGIEELDALEKVVRDDPREYLFLPLSRGTLLRLIAALRAKAGA